MIVSGFPQYPFVQTFPCSYSVLLRFPEFPVTASEFPLAEPRRYCRQKQVVHRLVEGQSWSLFVPLSVELL